MKISTKAASIYRWMSESHRGIMVVLFIVFLVIFYQYSQNGRYRYTRMRGYNEAYVIDSRTGEVVLGRVSTDKYYAYEWQLEADKAAARAEAKAQAAKAAKAYEATVLSNYAIGHPFTPDDLRQMALKVANHYGLPKDMFLGIAAAASDWNPLAKNPTSGALGLMQFTDDIAKKYFREPIIDDQNDPRYHPGKSLDASARYLVDLHKQYGNWRDAVLHYGENTPAYLNRVIKASQDEAWDYEHFQYGRFSDVDPEQMGSPADYLAPQPHEPAYLNPKKGK